ncbi:MAG: DNA internalization-related competence protein ComEC/Rec2 [Acidobacteriota bacterium]|nr:DNA internalization-related competence protein ComEC/Rec2 [Acidobacteriota bacterium]
MSSATTDARSPHLLSALPALFLAIGLGAGLHAPSPPGLGITLALCSIAGIAAAVLHRKFPYAALTPLALALAGSGYYISADQLAAHRAALPGDDALDKAYHIRARALYHWETQYGTALKVDRIRILSPEDTGIQLDALTLYLPKLEAPPARYESVETWIRLKRRYDPRPFVKPARELMDRYRPRFYGTVKTVALMNFTPGPPPDDNGLSKGNRELQNVFLAGRPSYLWRERLAPFGLGHLLAISGLHCVFVMFAIRLAVFPLRRPLLRAFLVVAGLAAFAHWVGWSASVTRASIMLAAWQFLPAFNRHRSWVRVWASLAILLVLADPLMLLNRGFWYSFAASLGIILGLNYRSRGPLDHPWLVRCRTFLPILAAQLFVIPINLLFGHSTELTNLFWNLGGILVLAVMGLLLALNLAATAFPLLVGAANGAESLLAALIEHAANLPASMELVRLPYSMWVTAPVLLTLALILGLGKRELRWYAALLLITGLTLFNRPPDENRLVMLDVGQGLSLLYVTAQGNGYLFDAGGNVPPGTSFDHVLKLHGVDRLEAVFVTHLDLDHYGLMEHLPRDTPVYVARSALAVAAEDPVLRGFPLKALEPGATLNLEGPTIEVHWPPPNLDIPNDNESSLVMTLRGEGWSLLITGDAGLWMEGRLKLEPGDGLRMLQVGHHGSKSATGATFLNRYEPHLALISCGRNNRFGHPHPTVSKRLTDSGVRILDTPTHGSVVLIRNGRPTDEASLLKP